MKLPKYAEIEREDGFTDEVLIPTEYEVCDGCHGKGTHVNRNIDGHGISPEEFAEDPDFAEDYFAGRYDVQCEDCGGLRVQKVPAWSQCSDEIKKWLEDWYNYEGERRREQHLRAQGYEF